MASMLLQAQIVRHRTGFQRLVGQLLRRSSALRPKPNSAPSLATAEPSLHFDRTAPSAAALHQDVLAQHVGLYEALVPEIASPSLSSFGTSCGQPSAPPPGALANSVLASFRAHRTAARSRPCASRVRDRPDNAAPCRVRGCARSRPASASAARGRISRRRKRHRRTGTTAAHRQAIGQFQRPLPKQKSKCSTRRNRSDAGTVRPPRHHDALARLARQCARSRKALHAMLRTGRKTAEGLPPPRPAAPAARGCSCATSCRRSRCCAARHRCAAMALHQAAPLRLHDGRPQHRRRQRTLAPYSSRPIGAGMSGIDVAAAIDPTLQSHSSMMRNASCAPFALLLRRMERQAAGIRGCPGRLRFRPVRLGRGVVRKRSSISPRAHRGTPLMGSHHADCWRHVMSHAASHGDGTRVTSPPT